MTLAVVLLGQLLLPGRAHADQGPYRDNIRQMLERGFELGPAGLEAAEAAYRAATRIQIDGPWLEYARGLVLLRQLRHSEATEQFQSTTELPGEPHWPAWRALVWYRLTANEFDSGLTAIEQFADRLANHEGDAQARAETAVWVGLDLQFRERFGLELLRAYDSGKSQTWQKQTELLQEINSLHEAVIQRNTQAKEQARETLKIDPQELTDKKKDVARTAEQWKEWLGEQKRDCDERLIALKKDREYLKTRAALVQQDRSSNGRTEGFNHGLRSIVWRAFGLRNFRHFRLRVLDAFGQPRPQEAT